MRRAGRIRAILVSLFVVGALTIAPLIFFFNTRLSETPEWWETVRQTQGHPNANNAARDFEAFTTTQITEPRDESTSWTLRVPQSYLNAWLAERFPAWVTNERGVEWPEDLQAVGVRVDDDALPVAASTKSSGPTRVLWLTLGPAPADSRQLLTVDAAGVNAIALPLAAFEAVAPDGVLERLRNALQTRAFPVDEAREVVIERLDLERGALVFTLTTRKKIQT